MIRPASWPDIERAVRTRDRSDPFSAIRDATDAHRAAHGCWAYPYADGTLLGAIGGAVRPSRVLELGTALGYTACWWGASGARVDTVDNDPVHVRLAREHLARAGLSAAATVHQTDFSTALDVLEGTYDVVFFDGYAPTTDLLARLRDRVADGGVLITANLDLGAEHLRSALAAIPGWTTRYVADLALTTTARQDHARAAASAVRGATEEEAR